MKLKTPSVRPMVKKRELHSRRNPVNQYLQRMWALVPIVNSNGVTVSGQTISFQGKKITVRRPSEAVLAGILARAMPGGIGFHIIAEQMWPNLSQQSGMCKAAYEAGALSQYTELIGLGVFNLFEKTGFIARC